MKIPSGKMLKYAVDIHIPVKIFLRANRSRRMMSEDDGESDFNRIVDVVTKNNPLYIKSAAYGLPKVNMSALKKSKEIHQPDDESSSLRRAIERSQNPPVKNIKSTQTVHAGGNTDENMRGVIRSQEKEYRNMMKKRYKPYNTNRLS